MHIIETSWRLVSPTLVTPMRKLLYVWSGMSMLLIYIAWCIGHRYTKKTSIIYRSTVYKVYIRSYHLVEECTWFKHWGLEAQGYAIVPHVEIAIPNDTVDFCPIWTFWSINCITCRSLHVCTSTMMHACPHLSMSHGYMHVYGTILDEVHAAISVAIWFRRVSAAGAHIQQPLLEQAM